jgi:hypothetical protein
MDDAQLQALLAGLQCISDQLAMEGRYVDAALVSGGQQAIRALRTKLEPPAAKPALAVVPEAPGEQAG